MADDLRAAIEAHVSAAKGRVWPASMDWTYRADGYRRAMDDIRALLDEHPAQTVTQEQLAAATEAARMEAGWEWDDESDWSEGEAREIPTPTESMEPIVRAAIEALGLRVAP